MCTETVLVAARNGYYKVRVLVQMAGAVAPYSVAAAALLVAA